MSVARSHQLPWTKFERDADVVREVTNLLPEGSPASMIRAFAEEQGLECSGVEDGIVYCSAPAHSPVPDAQAKWLMEMVVDGNRFRRMRVRRGYIAA